VTTFYVNFFGVGDSVGGYDLTQYDDEFDRESCYDVG